MKGEISMFDFTKAKENTMKGIGKHSTLISFVIAAVGVGATVYFASKEIPKAEKEVKEILAKEDLTKKQKVVESAKCVAKNCWKTTVIALGTVLLVTGTSAITAANTATTVAGLTNTIGMLEQKLKDTNEAIEEIPNKKVKEEVKNAVSQKAVNRATEDLAPEVFVRDDSCPDKYIWVDEWIGTRFKATYQQVQTAAKITELKIDAGEYQTIFDFYEELVAQGGEFLDETYPQLVSDFAWTRTMGFEDNVHHTEKGYTIHSIIYTEPTMNF